MRLRALVLLFGCLSVAELGLIAYLAKTKTISQCASKLSPAVDSSPWKSSVLKSAPSPSSFNWSMVESADYKTYIANLRAVGCPEETVRDIIITDIDKLLASRTRTILPARPAVHYWQPEEREVVTWVTGKSEPDEQALEKEKAALVKELLGFDFYAERRKSQGEEDLTDRRLAFLSTEKREQVRALLRKYAALERELQTRVASHPVALDPADATERKNLKERRQAELAALLSPSEAGLYELWMSNAAVATRFSLAGMDQPNEQDFLTVYNLRKRVEQEFDPETINVDDPSVMKKWSEASTAAEEQIRIQLGEQRYAEYQRGEDPNYHQLLEIARQYNLPQTAAGKIYDLKQQLEAAATKMISDQSVSEPDRIATLDPMRREAEESVRGLLGETAYQQYRRYGNADWLQSN
jgi:hypothetical protein